MEEKTLKLRNQLSFPLYLCSKEIIRRYTPFLEKLNLTYTQYIVMMFFWEMKKSNVNDLGKIMILDSSTLTPLLKKLENKGYITRTRSTSDKRNLELEITKKGMDLRKKATNIPNEVAKIVNLSDKDNKTLFELTNKILVNLEKEKQL